MKHGSICCLDYTAAATTALLVTVYGNCVELRSILNELETVDIITQ